MNRQETQPRTTPKTLLASYFVTVLVYVVAFYLPEQRVWGFNSLLLTSVVWRYGLLAVLIILPAVLLVFKSRLPLASTPTEKTALQSGMLPLTLFIIIMGIVFYQMRAQIYFFGDGYTLLSTLASDTPHIKLRELGECLAHIGMKNVFSTTGETAALQSFQFISIASGLGLLIAAGVGSVRLFKSNRDRLLFLLGIGSGGYMLLSFGYIENYSIFVLTVAIFSLAGIMIAQGSLTKWVVVPMLALAMFLHIFSVVLVPAGAYLLALRSRSSESNERDLSRRSVIILSSGVVVVVGMLIYFFVTNYFFRFAFVPLWANRFTVEGYTMFSVAHMLDWGNLLFVLQPGLLVLMATTLTLPLRQIAVRPEIRFLSLLTICSIGAAFIFDPKLGMPRDWDLFAFAGIPLTVLLCYVILKFSNRRSGLWVGVALAITLCFVTLFARAAIITKQDQGLAQFKSYVALDPAKSKISRSILVDYYYNIGDTLAAVQEFESWKEIYPEWFMNKQGIQLWKQKKFAEALALYRRVLKINPIFTMAYTNIGECFMQLSQYDSALFYLQLARGHNPYSPTASNNLGYAYYLKNDYSKAEKYWLEAYHLNSELPQPVVALVQLYELTKNSDKLIPMLEIWVKQGTASPGALKRLVELYLADGRIDQAATMLDLAIQRGLDSASVVELQSQIRR